MNDQFLPSGRTRDDLSAKLAVYLVADPAATSRNIIDVVQEALAGGVTCVQLRSKDDEGYDLWRKSVTLKRLCEEHDALFIVNDRLDVALASNADGVHLGVGDLPVDVARAMAPPGFIIGFSPDSLDDVRATRPLGADYAGIGPVYATGSKGDAGAPIGLEGLALKAGLVGVPTAGIGGIQVQTAGAVITAGAVGVAVIGAILNSDDPEHAASDLVQAVAAAKSGRA